MDMHTLVARLYRAFEKFFDFDKNLLTLGEHGVHEQTVTARLAIYLQSEFPRNDVDCEYNRYEEKKKIFIKENKTFRPDIIVHQRGSGCKNKLIVI